ncbi:MAG TPA: site-specific integrase [Kofleriaceae bacterium]|nr:site-specific integrase [Kofleriaceae bacterium]
MTVVAKQRAKKTIFYIVFPWQGKRVWERVGPDRREAERLDTKRRKEVKDATYEPPGERRATIVLQKLRDWTTTRKIRSADNEAALLERHVLRRSWFANLPLADVRPKHLVRLVNEMKTTRPPGEEDEKERNPLGEKSIAIVIGALHTFFRDQYIAELVPANPVVLPRGLLSRKSANPRAPYTLQEIARLTSPVCLRGQDGAEYPDQVVWNALAFYTGGREGEICGLRWSDWDEASAPLGCLTLERQYGGARLKTDRDRRVPVHPDLARALKAWRREGFELVFGRSPRPDDFIVPHRDDVPHTKSSAYKMWLRSCELAGVTNRSLHSTRHSFITHARRGGARREIVEQITHNAAGTIVDRYTHWEWEPLCEAMLCFRVPRPIVDASVDSGRARPRKSAPAPGLEVGSKAGNIEKQPRTARKSHV